MKTHIAGVVSDLGVWICVCIVQEHVTFLIVLAVGFDCSDAIPFTATIMVGSIALVWYPKVPDTDCTCFIPFLSNTGRDSGGSVCCIF